MGSALDPELDVAAGAMVDVGARFVVMRFATGTRCHSEAMTAKYDGLEFPVAGLSSIVGFKRLAGRPQDRQDLERLAEIHGELPIEPIPGLDS